MAKADKVKLNTAVDNVEKMAKELVVIPIVNSPIFPGMIAPIILSEEKYTPELDEMVTKTGYVALNLVKFKEGQDYIIDGEDEDEEELRTPAQPSSVEEYEMEAYDDTVKDLSSKDIYRVGVYCKVVKKLKLPDGSVNLLVHGLKRYRISKFLQEEPLITVRAEVFEDVHETDEELDAYTRSVINQVKKLSEINPYFNEEMKLAMLNSPSPGSLADLVAFALSLDVPEAQDFLETLIVKKRFAKLLVYLKREKMSQIFRKKLQMKLTIKLISIKENIFYVSN